MFRVLPEFGLCLSMTETGRGTCFCVCRHKHHGRASGLGDREDRHAQSARPECVSWSKLAFIETRLVLRPACCRCWAIVGLQCLVRDPVASQWLHALTQAVALPSGVAQGQLDAEPELQTLLRLCNGLRQPQEPAFQLAPEPADPVALVNQLRLHDKKLLSELLKVRQQAGKPESFRHQDWGEGFLLLLNALTATTTGQQAVSSTCVLLRGSLCCQLKTTAPFDCTLRLHPAAGSAWQTEVVWVPAGVPVLHLPTQRPDILCL